MVCAIQTIFEIDTSKSMIFYWDFGEDKNLIKEIPLVDLNDCLFDG